MTEKSILAKKTLLRSFSTLFAAVFICLGVFTSKKAVDNQIIYSAQNLIVILVSSCLGKFSGAGATGIFMIVGCLGLKVFPGFLSGFASFSNENAGFILGYFVASLITGLIAGEPSEYESKFESKKFFFNVLAIILGFFIIETCGILWFCNSTNYNFFKDFPKVFSDLIKPYIFNEIIKIFIVIFITTLLRPIIAKILYPISENEKEEKALLEKMKKKSENKSRNTKK